MHNIPVEFLPGDLVEIEMPGVPAEVDAVMSGKNGVEYRVVFWDDKQRRVEWVYGREIKPARQQGSCGFSRPSDR